MSDFKNLQTMFVVTHNIKVRSFIFKENVSFRGLYVED